jgi:hypothetical protein
MIPETRSPAWVWAGEDNRMIVGLDTHLLLDGQKRKFEFIYKTFENAGDYSMEFA